MEIEQQDKSFDQVPPLSDDEWLLRLYFSPEHIHNGEVVPTAISLSDLRERGFSLDRESIVNTEIIVTRAENQSVKKPENRAEPFLSRFECCPVRKLKHEDKPAFEVKESPMDENHAHAHILSAQKLGDGSLRKLRNQLIPHLQGLVALDAYIKDRQS